MMRRLLYGIPITAALLLVLFLIQSVIHIPLWVLTIGSVIVGVSGYDIGAYIADEVANR